MGYMTIGELNAIRGVLKPYSVYGYKHPTNIKKVLKQAIQWLTQGIFNKLQLLAAVLGIISFLGGVF